MRKKLRSQIITQKLEYISRNIFEKYKTKIIQHIENQPGVYALYDQQELYYVGRASDLVKRVNRHLKDQHSALWTHFSLYLTKKIQYINDIEAVVIAIAEPKGNKIKPELGGEEKKLKNILKTSIKEKYQEELKELDGRKSGHLKKTNTNQNRQSGKKPRKITPCLKNYFTSNRRLIKTYKGKTYKATLLTSGKIKYNKKIYSSINQSAIDIVKKISGRNHMQGSTFWFVKNNENKWVKLNELD